MIDTFITRFLIFGLMSLSVKEALDGDAIQFLSSIVIAAILETISRHKSK